MWDLCSSMHRSMLDISVLSVSLWDVCRWRLTRTIRQSTSVWPNGENGGKAIHLFVWE